jgi:hypothetical protein
VGAAVTSAIDAKQAGRRHLFVVEGLDAADALVRVLGVVAVQQARLAGAAFDVVDGRMVARMEVEGLTQNRAEHLRYRLMQLPLVTGVSLGWRLPG